MKDEITTAYSDLIQNQIELASTITSLIEEAVLRGAPAAHIEELRERMDRFEFHLNALSKTLMERHDSMEDLQNHQG